MFSYKNDYFHNLGGNPTWYYCDANNDGDDTGPSGIETDNLQILAEDGGSGNHEYICSLWSQYEVFAECCGDGPCYSGTGTTPRRCGSQSGGSGCRYVEGEFLVNNAGLNTRKAYLWEYDLEEFDKMMAVNLRAPFILSKLAFLDMKERKDGHILNILSTACHFANEKMSIYTATKKGFEGLPFRIKIIDFFKLHEDKS